MVFLKALNNLMIEITHTPLRFPSFPLCLGMGMLGTTATLSGIMGVTLTMAIGGADMPGKSPLTLSLSLWYYWYLTTAVF